jgi:light-regulated signal transduction histidine kinase (bacteriophytochrome)
MANTTELERLLQGCEAEQLHLSGAIQPFGAMLRIDAQTHLVTHASANLASFIGIDPREVLGHPIGEFAGVSFGDLTSLPAEMGRTATITGVIDDARGRIDALLIRGDGFILVELERNDTPAEPIPLQQLQHALLSAPSDLREHEQYHQNLLLAFRNIIRFDRVMIYHFAEDWSGEVIAEQTATGVGSYLGLRFPASDIPAIARNLYMVNPSRMIPDAKGTPVPVLGVNASVPDLTRSDLRSVSPVHLEYMANMGIGASFSAPIRIAGRLWGLVACHNRTPQLLAPDQRNACAILTNTYALGLTSYLAGRRLKMIDSLERRIDGVLEKLAQYSDPLDGIETNGTALMDAMGAQCFAMAIMDNVVIAGDGPDLDGLALIDDWFVNECKESMLSTDHLATLCPEQMPILSVASGMMAIKVRSPRSGWVRFFWFRPAEPQEVAWAGNPNKPLSENAGAIALSPRRSFERWVEKKSGYSRPWSNEEKMVASKFRNNLLRWL